MPSSILVVDDDILVAGHMASTVQDLGYQVEEAYSGAEALDLLRRNEAIDVLITDVNMPGMSGFELCERARALRPGLDIMLVTADIITTSAFACGMQVLAKPFARRELKALLDGRRRERSDAPLLCAVA